MERGSTKHGPHLDDEMQREVEGMLRSGQPNRVEPHRETEAARPDPDEGGAEADPAG